MLEDHTDTPSHSHMQKQTLCVGRLVVGFAVCDCVLIRRPLGSLVFV